KYRGKANQISMESIEKLVKKYSEAFMAEKRLSPHKLRHSFAKGFLKKGVRWSHCMISWGIIQLRQLPSTRTLVRKSSERYYEKWTINKKNKKEAEETLF